MNIVGFIPVRMGSSRFPGKPLAKILGLSMVEHVYQRSKMTKELNDVFVATCDVEIKQAVEAFGGKVIMTKSTHERASDRIAEAMLKAEKLMKKRIDIVVMIQGDEPMVFPGMIKKSVEPLLRRQDIGVANLMGKIESQAELEDRNSIKVVVDKEHFAMYFSRSPIPSTRKDTKNSNYYKQVCIIPFQRDFLLLFNKLRQTSLEISESIDMLRVLENGYPVKMVLTDFETFSVDTPADLKRVEKAMKKDVLIKKYSGKRR